MSPVMTARSPRGDLALALDPDGRVTYATPRGRRLLGVPDPLGMGVSEVADRLRCPELRELAGAPEQPPGTARVLVAAPAGGEPLRLLALPGRGGTSVFLDVASAPPGSSSEPEILSLLEAVLDNVRDAVLVTSAEPLDLPGPVIVYANRAFERHTGYRVDELIGQDPRILQGPGTDRAELDRLRAALEAWEPVTVQLKNYRKDGSEFWVELDIVPLADESGWYTHWISVQRDITERKKQETARLQQLRLVQTVLDSLPAQTAMLGPDGRLLAVNRTWTRTWAAATGVGQPDWLSVNYLQVCADSAAQGGPEASFAAAAADGISAVLEGRSADFSLDYPLDVAGEERWFHLHTTPLQGDAGAVVTHTDITRRKRAEHRLQHQAHHDELTGLPNRKLLLERLDSTLDQARTRGGLTAVAFLDLDNFKDVNDAYGHQLGDLLLEQLAERLQDAVGPDSLVARIGGDEFVLVLTGLARDWDPRELFEQLRTHVSAPLGLGIVSVRPSLSVGIATSPPHPGPAALLLRDADTAMYQAKREGRDRFAVFTDEIRDQVLAAAVTQELLADALERDRFVLHTQPVYDLVTGRCVGSEALLRLLGTDGELLLPGQFLTTLDNGPLGDDVGEWVLARALETQAAWQRTRPDHAISVNVSPRQVGHGRFPATVRRLVDRYGVDPGRLVIEVTEHFLLELGGRAEPELADLRAMGVRIALDDFGTGYSSLSHLSRVPVDLVKIDRSFLLEETGERREALLRATTDLARAVGAEPVAEGIEDAAQLDLVRRVGITRGQGFLLGRPGEPGDAPAPDLRLSTG